MSKRMGLRQFHVSRQFGHRSEFIMTHVLSMDPFQFNLVCDQQSWVEISTTSFYVGSFIGNCLFGYIADKFGRRRSFFVILIVLVVCGTANAFAKDIESFIILRFFTGLAFPALFQIPFIICELSNRERWQLHQSSGMEFMGNSGRIFSGLMISLFFGAAMALLGVVAMFIRRWRQLTFFCNAPFAVLFCYYFFLPESPRWSVSVGKWAEAKAQLKKIAKMNGKTDVDVDELVDSVSASRNDEIILKRVSDEEPSKRCRRGGDEEESQCNGSVQDAEFEEEDHHCDIHLVSGLVDLCNKHSVSRVMNAIIYNGLTLNVSNLPVDDYWSFIINGAVELPGYFVVWPLLQCAGRRWTLAATMIVCGIGCVSAMFVPEGYPWLVASASFIGKFGVGSGFAVIYIFAGELYPTVVRAIGMGMSSMVAGSGLLLAPHIVKLVSKPGLPLTCVSSGSNRQDPSSPYHGSHGVISWNPDFFLTRNSRSSTPNDHRRRWELRLRDKIFWTSRIVKSSGKKPPADSGMFTQAAKKRESQPLLEPHTPMERRRRSSRLMNT